MKISSTDGKLDAQSDESADSTSYSVRRSSTVRAEHRPVRAAPALIRQAHAAGVDEPGDAGHLPVLLDVRVAADDDIRVDARERGDHVLVRSATA